jgi:hypothetical protein
MEGSMGGRKEVWKKEGSMERRKEIWNERRK